ncbi:MAG TPA: hypothetical protein VLD58_01570, partial [Gemmatimonadales bacterium]|nr:hypothetical protein [Gemmatimonadales bacterium]
MRPAVVELSGLDPTTIVALVRHASGLGLEVLTGDDWAILGGSAARLSALARPWVVPEALSELANLVGRVLPTETPTVWMTASGPIQV